MNTEAERQKIEFADQINELKKEKNQLRLDFDSLKKSANDKVKMLEQKIDSIYV